jgi:chromosome segregation ATPase
MCFG